MKRRGLSLLLCFCMALSLFPISASAASAVNTVNLTLKAPQPNQMPTDASIPEKDSTVVTNTRWVSHHWGEGGKFSDFSGYGAYVTVRIKDGLDKVFAKKMTLNINGHASGSEDTGVHKEETYLMSMSEDRKEIEVFVNFDMPAVGGVTAGNRMLQVGDSLTREPTEERSNCVAENITVRSVPESPDGTVQPYSWIITDIDIRAKEGYLLRKLEYVRNDIGKKQVFCDWEAAGYVADYVYNDLFNAHITYYQWIGAAKGETPTDQMKEQSRQWMKGQGGYYSEELYTEVGTGKLRDYLAPRLSSEGKKVDSSGNLKDERAYSYSVPSMAGSIQKWARVADKFIILDDHAERKFPGAVGRWYLIRQGSKIGYIPEAYVENAVTPGVIDAGTPTAYPSTQTVDLDGRKVEFQMYALKDKNGNPTNYIKVRDLAKELTGSRAAFSVEWDGAVDLVPGGIYAPNGTEGVSAFTTPWPYTLPTSPTKVGGADSGLQAIVLTDKRGGGHTYYQLRDLGRALGFNVSWSAERGVFIETGKPYSGS